MNVDVAMCPIVDICEDRRVAGKWNNNATLKLCKECKREFLPKRAGNRYIFCSPECCTKYRNKEHYQNNKEYHANKAKTWRKLNPEKLTTPYERNPEKARVASRNSYYKNADKRLASMREVYRANPDKFRQRGQRWRREHAKEYKESERRRGLRRRFLTMLMKSARSLQEFANECCGSSQPDGR